MDVRYCTEVWVTKFRRKDQNFKRLGFVDMIRGSCTEVLVVDFSFSIMVKLSPTAETGVSKGSITSQHVMVRLVMVHDCPGILQLYGGHDMGTVYFGRRDDAHPRYCTGQSGKNKSTALFTAYTHETKRCVCSPERVAASQVINFGIHVSDPVYSAYSAYCTCRHQLTIQLARTLAHAHFPNILPTLFVSAPYISTYALPPYTIC